ncbi:GAF domain-containing protein [Sphingomonas panacisoli]|uniref:GAF domain-containing protein n=1 Tax=Sphingomonas panacisoli TaxID=1813879 RepID=A0A5B8LHX7_9SPHN|nr:GAF domain-containing protein [Sphingomonas panacisoli]QDZ07661.1 GAF domain-containing protein [Sphingomonas panacisoli]
MTTVRFKRWRLLSAATNRLSEAASLDGILEILRISARAILQSDGVAVVRREDDLVHYVGEDAIAPLWSGQRFPIETCISGIAMVEREMIVIPDIRLDPRVPHNAYLSTFVASMAMAPIGHGNPVAAIGAYWRSTAPIEEDALTLLDMLAKGASAQLERIADQRMGDKLAS